MVVFVFFQEIHLIASYDTSGLVFTFLCGLFDDLFDDVCVCVCVCV